MDVRNIDDMPAFTTKDGSQIRELLAHRNSCIAKQSLAEASVAISASTAVDIFARCSTIFASKTL